uniref:Innexin n=1 Tax=Panagrolaimus davidi TaxID=227884 RepID=A0A914QB85_9BILA
MNEKKQAFLFFRSKLALTESTCRGASIYDLSGTTLDEDAQRHCQTAKRYFVGINEPFQYDQSWRQQRQVKNPEWILWFWAPIVFVMYVLTRYLWSLLMENQGINFNNVVNASTNVVTEYDGITEVDEDKLYDKVPVIADNFRCATSSNAFAAFIWFEIILVLAPAVLLMFILPVLVGGNYRTWGLDVARAWQGSTLTPAFGSRNDTPLMPLIPRITYCDYHFVTLGNDHILTYRCYLDANWHERTALFTWIMLVFLTFMNFFNLLFWLSWALKMNSKRKRQKWVMKKWLNNDDFCLDELKFVERFAAQFKMGNLLLFYYIEAHTDRVVASAFAKALFNNWMFKQQEAIENNVRINMLHMKPTAPPFTPENVKIQVKKDTNIGWKNVQQKDIGWNGTQSEPGGIEETLQRITPYPDTPASGATGFSFASTTLLNEIPRRTPPRSQTPQPRKERFYRSNITSKYAAAKELEPSKASLPASKLIEKRKQDKKRTKEDYQKIYSQRKCSIM